MAHYHLGNYSEAMRWSERAMQRRRTCPVLRTEAATLGQLGRTEEGYILIGEMECIKPVNTEPYADPAHEVH